ncbi:MAG TPA: 4-(cytidine 5'-diphospho)-2-C-methyl-D-erythritol kinase [Acidimicrobiales bacterium]|nr:4-(cytidine 5'-diphospho)-2-C-methyl-D-erythritol kinase [Acidimicrobiales bacterium]
MRVVAHAKLTLSLRVTGVRPDGYHLIDAEMTTLDLADELRIDDGEGISLDGEPVEGGDDLVGRALAVAGEMANVRITKRIPAGAGLGGGSADAAAVLRWAGVDDLHRAASLGADVPFCLVGGRARVAGIGEVVEPLPFVPESYTLVLAPFGCSTPAVYAAWDELGGPAGDNGNDLEPAALHVEPRLAAIRDAIADATGARPRLAGSGATWFLSGELADLRVAGCRTVVTRTVPGQGSG